MNMIIVSMKFLSNFNSYFSQRDMTHLYRTLWGLAFVVRRGEGKDLSLADRMRVLRPAVNSPFFSSTSIATSCRTFIV